MMNGKLIGNLNMSLVIIALMLLISGPQAVMAFDPGIVIDSEGNVRDVDGTDTGSDASDIARGFGPGESHHAVLEFKLKKNGEIRGVLLNGKLDYKGYKYV